jgi:hypothetical protein
MDMNTIDYGGLAPEAGDIPYHSFSNEVLKELYLNEGNMSAADELIDRGEALPNSRAKTS